MDGHFSLTFAVAASVALVAPAEASALAGPPIIPDREGASRVLPGPGLLGEEEAVETVEDEKDEVESAPGEWNFGMQAHGRVIFIPDFILDRLFSTHPSGTVTANTGLGLEYGTRSYQLVLELDWTGAQLAEGNWLVKGGPPFAAKYAEIDLHWLSVDFSVRGQSHFGDIFSIYYGGGVGLGGLVGVLNQTEVLPSCVEPIETCGHWRNVTHGQPKLPSLVWPVVHVVAGMQLELGSYGLIRLEGGFKNAFYLGLAAGFHL
jgi:hypothetical protein